MNNKSKISSTKVKRKFTTHLKKMGVLFSNSDRKYDYIKEDMLSGKFNIQYPKLYFSALEEQGIIFLNTAFTCRVGKPGTHIKIWSTFTKLLLEYISNNIEPTWILWGGKAQELSLYMKGNKILNYHPSYKDRIANKYPFFDKPFNFLNKDWTGIIYKVKDINDSIYNISILNNCNDLSIFINKEFNNILSTLKEGEKCLAKLSNNYLSYIVTIKIVDNKPTITKLSEEE